MSSHRRRVLIVDDSSIARATIRELLAPTGYQIFERESPIGATVEILKNEIELVILDMNMPAMSGERFAQMMRSNPRFSNLMIVLVSGDSEDRLHEVGESIQADAVLQKAELKELLLDTVERLLNREPSTS
ncbi:MAG: response regulator [Myxococcota bacterium]